MADLRLHDLLDMDSESYARFADLVEFDGPPVQHIAGTNYVTLTQFGVKPEGHSIYPDAETRCWTEAEAIWRFKRVFHTYLLGYQPAFSQLAWRERPTVRQGPHGDYVVYSRFALLGGS